MCEPVIAKHDTGPAKLTKPILEILERLNAGEILLVQHRYGRCFFESESQRGPGQFSGRVKHRTRGTTWDLEAGGWIEWEPVEKPDYYATHRARITDKGREAIKP